MNMLLRLFLITSCITATSPLAAADTKSGSMLDRMPTLARGAGVLAFAGLAAGMGVDAFNAHKKKEDLESNQRQADQTMSSITQRRAELLQQGVTTETERMNDASYAQLKALLDELSNNREALNAKTHISGSDYIALLSAIAAMGMVSPKVTAGLVGVGGTAAMINSLLLQYVSSKGQRFYELPRLLDDARALLRKYQEEGVSSASAAVEKDQEIQRMEAELVRLSQDLAGRRSFSRESTTLASGVSSSMLLLAVIIMMNQNKNGYKPVKAD